MWHVNVIASMWVWVWQLWFDRNIWRDKYKYMNLCQCGTFSDGGFAMRKTMNDNSHVRVYETRNMSIVKVEKPAAHQACVPMGMLYYKDKWRLVYLMILDYFFRDLIDRHALCVDSLYWCLIGKSWERLHFSSLSKMRTSVVWLKAMCRDRGGCK